LTHDRDKCGHYHGYRVAAPVFSLSVHLPVSPIRCLLGTWHAVDQAASTNRFASIVSLREGSDTRTT
jgi:hypothetical protein